MHRKQRTLAIGISMALGLAGATPALAGGLYIWEFGHPAQGASGAGAGALAQDASTVFLNPAGIMELEESQFLASGVIIDSSIKFQQNPSLSATPPAVADSEGNRPAGNGGDAGSTAVGGAFFYARPVNDKWGWGVSLASISGAALEHEAPQDFAGRYWATEVDLLTVNVTPSVAYRVNDSFSLGFGLPVMFGTLDMDIAIPSPLGNVPDGKATISDGEDTQVTFTVSALWEPTERLNLGIQYLGEIDIEFDSDLILELPAGVTPEIVAADVGFTYPQTIRTWLAQDLNDQLTLLATFAWEDWSSFDNVLISTARGGAPLPRDWEDTWHYGLGLKIDMGTDWELYTGIAYDTDPTRAEDRTADMPIDEQWRLSFGATKTRENGHKLGFVVTWADYGDAAIANGGARPVSGLPWTVNGEYSTNRLIFAGVNYGW